MFLSNLLNKRLMHKGVKEVSNLRSRTHLGADWFTELEVQADQLARHQIAGPLDSMLRPVGK